MKHVMVIGYGSTAWYQDNGWIYGQLDTFKARSGVSAAWDLYR